MTATDFPIVLLKLSGEGFAPDTDSHERLPISPHRVDSFAEQIVTALRETPTRLAIVVGGGNIWRGGDGPASGMDRFQADSMGMLATTINALALRDALKRHGAEDPRVMSAIPTHKVCEDWIVGRARKHLEKGRIVICAAGMGEPYFTTDTAAVQRARDIRADILLKGTHDVEGIYTVDPRIDPAAPRVLIEEITFDEVIQRGLKVMDSTAFTHAREAKLPIRVFNAAVAGNIGLALSGHRSIGSLVHA